MRQTTGLRQATFFTTYATKKQILQKISWKTVISYAMLLIFKYVTAAIAFDNQMLLEQGTQLNVTTIILSEYTYIPTHPCFHYHFRPNNKFKAHSETVV